MTAPIMPGVPYTICQRGSETLVLFHCQVWLSTAYKLLRLACGAHDQTHMSSMASWCLWKERMMTLQSIALVVAVAIVCALAFNKLLLYIRTRKNLPFHRLVIALILWTHLHSSPLYVYFFFLAHTCSVHVPCSFASRPLFVSHAMKLFLCAVERFSYFILNDNRINSCEFKQMSTLWTGIRWSSFSTNVSHWTICFRYRPHLFSLSL